MAPASSILKVCASATFLPWSSALKTSSGPAACSGVTLSFEDFVQKYERQYSPGSEEYARRQALFEDRVTHIAIHNCAEQLWKAQVNHLFDWTEEELPGP